MGDGYYIALSGGQAAWRSLDVLANNLANADTQGFKADRVSFRVEMPARAAGQAAGPDASALAERFALVGEVTPDLSGGALVETGRALDVALRGEGFLALEGDGVQEAYYTRDGGLEVDREGFLAHRSGRRVRGDAGPLQVGEGPVEVDAAGRVLRGDQVLGRIGVVSLPAEGLAKVGNNLWTAPAGSAAPVESPEVVSGHLEGSNVVPARALVDMVKVTRAYQAQQKVIETLSALESQRNSRLARAGAD